MQIQIWERVKGGDLNFSLEPDDRIAFDASQGFRVRMDLISIGETCIESIHAAEPFFEGSVASVSELLRLRAVTVVNRGGDGDVADFRWLLSRVVEVGQVLLGYDNEDLEWVIEAGESCLGRLERLLLWACLPPTKSASAATRLLS